MVTPIAKPKTPAKQPKSTLEGDGIKKEPEEEADEIDVDDLEAEEMERLHSIGIPVPGVEIRVDKQVVKVWLETLEVECGSNVLKERVKAVVERAVETAAPLWGKGKN